MFNGILKSDDVEVIDCSGDNVFRQLSSDCKSNIILAGGNNINCYLHLPTDAYMNKVINITAFRGTIVRSAFVSALNVYIQHSNTTLFTLKQGTVSFMYVGQQLNGLTATDKAKSGWIILGGVQGDTAITGYAGSIAIGSGAYCGNINGVSIGKLTTSGSGGISIGINSISGTSSVAVGDTTDASSNYSVAIGYGATASYIYGVSIGQLATPAASRIAFKSNNVFTTAKDAQAGKFILMRQTTDATPLVMSATNTVASTTNILILPNNGTYAFKGIVVAKDATTLDSAMWEVTALMKRGANASTTALVGTPTITKVFNDAGAAAWTIALTADTTNGGGTITVTGEAGKTIRWICNIDSAELI